MRSLFRGRGPLEIIGHKRLWFIISGLIVLVSVIALAVNGLNFGVEFTGGTALDIQTRKGTTIEQVRAAAGKHGLADAQIQAGSKNTFIIKTLKLDDEKKDALVEGLKRDAGLVRVLGASDVGPGWGAQVSRQAIIALIVFLFAILIYISFRFEFKMAVCSIIEIFHDFIITVGIYALIGREVTPATVIAVLTIVGYSLYDSIVMFDRIKENADLLTKQSKKTYSETVNDSVNQVLARSINTSLTTLIPIVTILIFGGETLKAFAFPLFIGVASGTYSSIFLGAPLLALWKESEPKYRAYRERVERAQARKAHAPAAAKEPVRAARGASRPKPASKAAGPAPRGSGKKAAAGKAAGATGTARKEAAAKPAAQPRPKPKPASKAAEAPGKGGAKARTKGPGSGKKKKKKKR